MVYFINSKSSRFFDRFSIKTEFLDYDCDTWKKREDYTEGLNIVKNQRVVNDAAERAVHLAEDYIKINLVKKEDQVQYLLQVVSEFKKDFPDSNKKTLLMKLKT